MSKVAVVVLADTAGGEGLGRVVNALNAAHEFKSVGDEVRVLFSGAGTKWIGQLAQPSHRLHGLFQELNGVVAGACSYCADAFGVADDARSCGIALLEEYGTNMSYRRLIQDGYQVLTF